MYCLGWEYALSLLNSDVCVCRYNNKISLEKSRYGALQDLETVQEAHHELQRAQEAPQPAVIHGEEAGRPVHLRPLPPHVHAQGQPQSPQAAVLL